MSSRLQTLIHLAGVIDSKREKMERALTEARKEQLSSQIARLSKHFQAEYAVFMATASAEDEATMPPTVDDAKKSPRTREE
jgi:hypothetical protein